MNGLSSVSKMVVLEIEHLQETFSMSPWDLGQIYEKFPEFLSFYEFRGIFINFPSLLHELMCFMSRVWWVYHHPSEGLAKLISSEKRQNNWSSYFDSIAELWTAVQQHNKIIFDFHWFPWFKPSWRRSCALYCTFLGLILNSSELVCRTDSAVSCGTPQIVSLAQRRDRPQRANHPVCWSTPYLRYPDRLRLSGSPAKTSNQLSELVKLEFVWIRKVPAGS